MTDIREEIKRIEARGLVVDWQTMYDTGVVEGNAPGRSDEQSGDLFSPDPESEISPEAGHAIREIEGW